MPRGRRDAYQPNYRERAGRPAAPTTFTHIGNNLLALQHLTRLVKDASLIEDTAVRWHGPEKRSLYEQSLLSEFAQALKNNTTLEYRSVTGPVVDAAYKGMLEEAFTELPHRLKLWRLHHSAVLMNFVVLYTRPRFDGTRRRVVYFGFGRQTGSDHLDKTNVFVSESIELVHEFRRLFGVLQERRFSREITLSDPDFGVSRPYTSDVLATFSGWPEEMGERLRQCRHHIRVCTVTWPSLHDYIPLLGEALHRGCGVSVTLWRPDSNTVTMRSGDIAARPGMPPNFPIAANTIESNYQALSGLHQLHRKLEIRFCEGWASSAIYWLDDLLYFAPYWTQTNANGGPHFLVHAESTLGQDLRGQYRTMLERSRFAAHIMWLPHRDLNLEPTDHELFS